MTDLFARPTWRFVLGRPAHFIAFGGGAGLIPFAPGTFGTLLALPLFWLIQPRVEALAFLLLIAALFGLGVWACEMTGLTLTKPTSFQAPRRPAISANSRSALA